MNGEAGKGDTPRPKSVDEKTYSKNYARAFGKKKRWWETDEHKEWVKETDRDRKRLEGN